MAVKTFDFGELRSLLQQEPSAQVWEQLCALVFPAKWEKASEQWLPYAEDILDRGWPDHLRELPKGWIGRKHIAAAALCRHLCIDVPSARHVRQYTALLERARPPIKQLTLRYVHYRHSMDKEMAQQLWAALDSLGSIDRMVVMHGDVSGPPVAALLAGSIPGRLRELRLWFNPVSAAEALALVGATSAATLRILELQHIEGGSAGLGAAIVGAGLCEALEELRLTATLLEEAEIAALAARRWPMLHTLELERALGEPANEALGRLLRGAPSLKRLNLASALIDESLVRGIAALEGVELEALDLSGAMVSAATLAALLASPVCARLKVLRINQLPVSGEVGAAIAGSTMAQTLEELGLEGTSAAGAFWEELARVELPRLRVLSLDGTQLTARAERALWSLRAPELGEVARGHIEA
jgi:hypothetical protein